MRTVNFRDGVIYPAAHLLGIDVEQDLNRDHAQAFASFANHRLRYAWEFWNWPELNITEERAFRTIWNDTRTFKEGDELFYIPTLSYFTTTGNPLAGTVPTDTNFFAPLDLVNRYIAYDQVGRRPIGQALQVWNGNPFMSNGALLKVPSVPSSNGIQIANGWTGPTAWLSYRVRESRFTAKAYDPTKQYKRGDLVYWTDGDCYAAVVTVFTGHSPDELSYWQKMPMPYFLANYLQYAVAGDAADDLTTSQLYRAEAENALQCCADRLLEQGQKVFYKWPGTCYYLSFMPLGASVPSGPTTLTDQDDPYAVQGEIMLDSGITVIPNGQQFVDVTFAVVFPTDQYSFDELTVENEIDNPPLGIYVTTIAQQDPTGFRAMVNAPPDNNNYKLRWRVTA
jgi:hypothetical protein